MTMRSPKKIKPPFRVAVDCPVGMTYTRRGQKIFVYWKNQMEPVFTFHNHNDRPWYLGDRKFPTSTHAIAYAAHKLQDMK